VKKKIIFTILLAVGVFILAACSIGQGNGLLNNPDNDENIQGNGSANNAFGNLEFNLPAIGSVSEYESPDGGKTPKAGYPLVPIEILTLTNPGRNALSGNRYYADGIIMEIGEDYDGVDIINIYLHHEENELFETIIIVGKDFMELFFDDMMNGQLVRYYIEYIGFSDEFGLALGVLESYERIDPF
jgi:hypothetical protein